MKPITLYEIYFDTLEHPTFNDYLLYYLFKFNYFGIFNKAITKLLHKKYDGVETDKFVESRRLRETMFVKSYGTVNKAKKIHITKPYKIWSIETKNGKHLRCADNHIVYDENGKCKYVKDLRVGDKVITDQGVSPIVFIDRISTSEYMCDLEL